MTNRARAADSTPRLPAKDIIAAVVANMRANLEELTYSTLAPSRYTIYLHPTEFARLRGIVSILQEQTLRALSDELQRLNRRSAMSRMVGRVRRSARVAVQNAAPAWEVTFVADADEELEEGAVLVDSELVLPARPELGVGQSTRRVKTVAGTNTSKHESVAETSPTVSGALPVTARVRFTDDQGPHDYEVTKDLVTIGRGGAAYPVDIRVAAPTDVSRIHARIRREPATGTFFLVDLSTFGTTLNGRHVPKRSPDGSGTRPENESETALTDGARIGLAGIVFLDFTTER